MANRPIALRLLAQGMAHSSFIHPEEVVRHFGCIQAQDAAGAAWAVALRTRRPSYTAFTESFKAGRVLCSHLLRCTWQFVAAEDYRTFLSVCAAVNRRLVTGYCASLGNRMDEVRLRRGGERMARIVAEHGSIGRAELLRLAAVSGVTGDAHTLSCFLTVAEADGLICSGAWNGRKRTYAPLDSRVPQESPMGRDEALARLALAFFRSHGPATVADFAWWSGAGLAECRAAVADIGNAFCKVKFGNVEYLVASDAKRCGTRKDTVHLLPAYDEWLIGYKDRSLVLPHRYAYRAHNNFGRFHPIVICGGVVVGNWRKATGRSAGQAVETDFFEPSMAPGDKALKETVTRFVEFAEGEQKQ